MEHAVSLKCTKEAYEFPMEIAEGNSGFLRTFARKFSNIDFFLKMLPLKDDDLVMSET